MPVMPRRVPADPADHTSNGSHTASANQVPDGLRPYIHHGVDLTVRGGHGVGECPFCFTAGKFSVDVDSGLWRCFVCGEGTDKGGGNALVFLRHGRYCSDAT